MILCVYVCHGYQECGMGCGGGMRCEVGSVVVVLSAQTDSGGHKAIEGTRARMYSLNNKQ